MEFPESLKYTREHEWIAPDGRVGITAYAQDALGDVVFVELPQVGQDVTAGGAVGTIESVKSVSEIYSPASGRVVAVNPDLADHPEWVNQDPYGNGWLFQLEASDLGELLTAEAYRQLVEGA
ncbi:glycine cleavage system H protein [Sulfobacillus acidophilus TPY]|uniref:Glycine cleavage system H protein n=1 Tax=Sulfobacillus acidophilus (strain ATCC 700253 / DSM 10332 / NAL) TaxID=679936 RepID=G8TTY9_SULAD|nr:glycine cleavage system H protein [Sulfobacillus acidophilus TPY]AEW04580.1 Glycine cleavage system H protein [Sulfobacillus acidophilus DSM 10332]MCY0864098.1 glycine cleavage system protein GcvH [Sulfobacillus sp.]